MPTIPHSYVIGGWITSSLLVSLPAFAGPGFTESLDAAWLHSPEANEPQQLQHALQQRPSDWLATQPSVNIGYATGNQASAIASEWQAGVSASVYLPAAARTNQALNSLEQQQISHNISAQRWQWSGRLQDWWWQWQTLNVNQQRLQQQASALDQQLQWLEVMIRQGERPAADRLPLQQSRQAIETSLLQLAMERQQQAARFQQWTGLTELPDNWSFRQSPEQTIDQHPLLQMESANRDSAQLQQQLQQHSRMTPEFSLGLRHVAAVDQLPSADLVEAGIRVPFGSTGYRERRDAIRQITSSERALLDQRQTLERERTALAAYLPNLQTQASHLQELGKQASTQYQSQYQAWKNGTLPGLQWLQVQDSIWQLQQQADEAQLRYSRAISDWNQLQGVIPQ